MGCYDALRVDGSRWRTRLLLVAVTLLSAIAVGMVLVPTAQAATATTKTLFEHNYGTSSKSSKTVKAYDVTNDGAADTVTFSMTSGGKRYRGMYRGMSVAVNGVTVGSLSSDGGAGSSGLAKIITLSNGKSFLYLEYGYSSDKDGYERTVWKLVRCTESSFDVICENGMFKGEFISDFYNVWKIKASGKTVKITFYPYTTTLGAMFYVTFNYKYAGGTLKRATAPTSNFTYYNFDRQKQGKSYLTSAVKMTVYKAKACKAKKFTAAKGTKMKVTKVFLKSGKLRYKVKTSSGKTGWICPKTYSGNFTQSGVSKVKLAFKEIWLGA